mgnify:CR=1 FL=1
MKKIILLFCACAAINIAQAQREEIIPATQADSAWFQADKDGKIYRDSFKNILTGDQIEGLEQASIQQVRDLNYRFEELWKTWAEAKATQGNTYLSEAHFYEKKKDYEKEALGYIIYDGESGVENCLQLYRAFFDNKTSSYYRYRKNSNERVPAYHVVRDDRGIYWDSVYEDVPIPAAKIWITNKHSSYKTSPTIKQYIINVQTASMKNRGGVVKFNGGDYQFTKQLKWNDKMNRYEGAIDYWQEFEKVTPEGYKYSDLTHRRIIVYIVPEIIIIGEKTYVGWVIKFGNIQALETK